MKQQLLNGTWMLQEEGSRDQLEAQVPGSVYQTYLEHGKMEDPYWKDHEKYGLELSEKDYRFVRQFDLEPGIASCDQVYLKFEGLDTLADIYLNGTHIGYADNMHCIWEYEVKELLADSANQLEILLHSPTRYIREAYEACRADGSGEAMTGFPHIRKAHYMFGWDWGAHLPDAGIFRDVKLLGISRGRIESVYVRQSHQDGIVDLRFEIEERDVAAGAQPDYQIQVTDPQGKVRILDDPDGVLTIDDPALWWPNGYGEQPLYTVKVIQKIEGMETDCWERRIGLRTMTVKREKDQWGESFAHCVNGVCCFAMGADYIPEDHLLGRTSKEKTRDLLQQCKEANFNTIRVWGGGYYPNDWFFDLCDEMGFMVWQDFMFACAVYELTEEFEAGIRREIEDNIKRIRHHASLGLWCGNNEMEMFVDQGLWVSKPSQKADYIKMYEYIIPKLLKEHDPDTFYWPASPSSGGSFDEPNGPDRGDVHYWSVWHGNDPFTEYRKYYFRYLSEFGFQSFPSIKTIETFTDDERDLNVFSYVMEKHQRNASANGKIMNYMQQTFLYPTDFETFIYASQLLAAEGIRYGVEHFRRNRGRCMGAVYWQLNDCWPVISWASIDYEGRWKALHYYAKRFFAPYMISCEEEGMLTQQTDINQADFDIRKAARLNVANETRTDETFTVTWQLRRSDASVIREGVEELAVPALSSVYLEQIDLPDAALYDDYFSYQLSKDGEVVSDGTVIFSLPKYFRYKEPNLSVKAEGDTITVTADAYAKSVCILNENEDLILSDNYFDMNAGTKTVKVVSGALEGLKVKSVYDIR